MAKYTDILETQTYDIFEAEDYIEELKKISEKFRTFDKALDTFLVEHGYAGDVENTEEKIKFISDKLKAAGVPVPKKIKEWYSKHIRIKRKTAFQICFGFGLKLEEVDDFLRRICLERGFDCHSVEEVVYFFAFKNELSYMQAQDILSKVTKVTPSRMPKEDLIYTDVIAEELDEISTEDDLIKYLNTNSDKF